MFAVEFVERKEFIFEHLLVTIESQNEIIRRVYKLFSLFTELCDGDELINYSMQKNFNKSIVLEFVYERYVGRNKASAESVEYLGVSFHTI